MNEEGNVQTHSEFHIVTFKMVVVWQVSELAVILSANHMSGSRVVGQYVWPDDSAPTGHSSVNTWFRQ